MGVPERKTFGISVQKRAARRGGRGAMGGIFRGCGVNLAAVGLVVLMFLPGTAASRTILSAGGSGASVEEATSAAVENAVSAYVAQARSQSGSNLDRAARQLITAVELASHEILYGNHLVVAQIEFDDRAIAAMPIVSAPGRAWGVSQTAGPAGASASAGIIEVVPVYFDPGTGAWWPVIGSAVNENDLPIGQWGRAWLQLAGNYGTISVPEGVAAQSMARALVGATFDDANLLADIAAQRGHRGIVLMAVSALLWPPAEGDEAELVLFGVIDGQVVGAKSAVTLGSDADRAIADMAGIGIRMMMGNAATLPLSITAGRTEPSSGAEISPADVWKPIMVPQGTDPGALAATLNRIPEIEARWAAIGSAGAPQVWVRHTGGMDDPWTAIAAAGFTIR